jgi:hypothetical protein
MIFLNLMKIFASSKLWSVNICSRQCLHIFHTVLESAGHKYITKFMSVLISWCLPGVQSSFRILKPYVGDYKSISFTEVSEHLISLISPSELM